MAVTLSITDNVTTINLQTTTRGVMGDYVPTDGGTSATTVTETIRVWLEDAQDDRVDVVNALNRHFERARHYDRTATGRPVYLKISAYSGDAEHESEILDGRVVWGSGTLLAGLLPSAKAEIAIIVTRRNWWRDATPVALELTNSHATATTGVTVSPDGRTQTIRATTNTSGNQQLFGASVIDTTKRWRIRSWNINSSGTPTVSLGNVSAGAQYLSGAALTATNNEVTLLTRIPGTANLWCNANSTATLEHTVILDLVD